MKAKIVSSDDISGSCDISDDCTTFTCNLVVVKNDFPVDFTLKVTLLPCSSPYAVELSLHAACDGAKVLMNDEMFNESRRVNVVLFVVDAVFVVNISQDCDGLTLSVSSVYFGIGLNTCKHGRHWHTIEIHTIYTYSIFIITIIILVLADETHNISPMYTCMFHL